jgi:hypothetical protein
MKKINLFISLGIIFFMFGCEGPEGNPNNPDLMVINNLEDYKVSKMNFNNRLILGLNEYLLPGEHTEYMKVDASPNVMLSYRWENVNNPGDSGETGKLFTVGNFEGFEENNSYTLSVTGDKNEPTIYIFQP